MKNLKSAILTLLILIGLLTSYMIFKFDTNHILKITAQAYEKRDYVKASRMLRSLKKTPSSIASLYEGYLMRAQKQIKESTYVFLTVFNQTDDTNLKKEASFNLLLNAYESGDFDFIQQHLKEEDRSSFNHFFSALVSYHQKDYTSAYAHFIESENRKYYSSWMERDWEEKFPKIFEISCIAHCLIEIGRPHQGRVLLENYIKNVEEKKGYFSYLLGLSYLKEIEGKATQLTFPYFRNAHPHFKRVAFWDKENLDLKETISMYYKELLERVLKESLYDDLGEVLGFIDDLKLFDENYQALLFDRLEFEKQQTPIDSFVSLIKQLNFYSFKLDFKKAFSNYCLSSIHQLIEKREISLLTTIGTTLANAADCSELQLDTLTELLKQQLISHLDEEDVDLTQTYALLLFWDAIQREDTKRMQFLAKLTPEVKRLWSIDSAKALTLSKYLDQFSRLDQKAWMQQEMLEILHEISAKVKSPDFQEAYLYFNPLITR